MIALHKYIGPPFRGNKLLKDSAAQEQVGANAAWVYIRSFFLTIRAMRFKNDF